MSQNKITIVTHNSSFHTDDIFAVATLLLALEKDHDISVVRSRDMEIAKAADYLVDFGGEDDPDKNRFDHHQKGGAGKRENGVPYASFGLVWKKFGPELSGSIEASQKIDQSVVQPIDAGDNGLQFLETKIPGLHSFDIGLITSVFHPTWKEETNLDDIFLKLVSYAKFLLNRLIISTKDSIDGSKIVAEIYSDSPDKRLIILPSSKYPWEEVLSKFPEPLFVIYPNSNIEKTWTVKGIRNDLFTYVTRKKLPESWAGKRDKDLEEVTGVEGSVFCHNAQFMAVNKTKEGALKMAEIALNS